MVGVKTLELDSKMISLHKYAELLEIAVARLSLPWWQGFRIYLT